MLSNAISILTQRYEYEKTAGRLTDRNKGRISLRKAIANAYSPFMGKDLDPETEVVITTGANEGILSAFMAFVEPGDEVIVFEPYFDQ